ncbi:N-acetylmuramoyl-L-alanine amidase [Marinoscillum sp. 108]|uniref:N-acetylmuramoyl-L-alanine amidase n=1 Tax=Marinoscillum luteum TaxID=861051 RepID=A0ABW7N440_9BACT|nr:N-acetylmuramoyl-L-alanine amidase [Marinoscillum sp. 108]VXD12371.1 N-acetylmuramoyl-L-alanine amidase [Marinoscillum sp. 108]
MLKRLVTFLLLAGSYLTHAQEHKKVMAVQGDGIYSLLRNSGLEPKKYLAPFIELNKENLSSENGLFIGRIYLLPKPEEKVEKADEEVVMPDSVDMQTVKATKVLEKRYYGIFGADYAMVSIESRQLEGAVFYLISGHGGPDPGAVEHYGGQLLAEDEYAYDVTLRLARKLIANGALVYLITRDPNDGIRDARLLEVDHDEETYPSKRIPRNHSLRLKQRVEVVNELYERHAAKPYQRIIETHVDSRSKSENIDVFFYYHELSKDGQRLAQNLQQTFKQKYARYQPNRKYSGTIEPRNSLYIIKYSKAPTVYVEIGNLKNTRDQRRILDWENRDAIAMWITDGVIADFKER